MLSKERSVFTENGVIDSGSKNAREDQPVCFIITDGDSFLKSPVQELTPESPYPRLENEIWKKRMSVILSNLYDLYISPEEVMFFPVK